MEEARTWTVALVLRYDHTYVWHESRISKVSILGNK